MWLTDNTKQACEHGEWPAEVGMTLIWTYMYVIVMMKHNVAQLNNVAEISYFAGIDVYSASDTARSCMVGLL
jgi:hypothetical protein